MGGATWHLGVQEHQGLGAGTLYWRRQSGARWRRRYGRCGSRGLPSVVASSRCARVLLVLALLRFYNTHFSPPLAFPPALPALPQSPQVLCSPQVLSFLTLLLGERHQGALAAWPASAAGGRAGMLTATLQVRRG